MLNLQNSSLNLPNRHKRSNWPKAQKSQISFGHFSKMKKAKRVQKMPKITNLASKKLNWQPCRPSVQPTCRIKYSLALNVYYDVSTRCNCLHCFGWDCLASSIAFDERNDGLFEKQVRTTWMDHWYFQSGNQCKPHTNLLPPKCLRIAPQSRHSKMFHLINGGRPHCENEGRCLPRGGTEAQTKNSFDLSNFPSTWC